MVGYRPGGLGAPPVSRGRLPSRDGELVADVSLGTRLGSRVPPAGWAGLRDEIGQSFSRTDALNLDRKQTILGAFFAIERAAG